MAKQVITCLTTKLIGFTVALMSYSLNRMWHIWCSCFMSMCHAVTAYMVFTPHCSFVKMDPSLTDIGLMLTSSACLITHTEVILLMQVVLLSTLASASLRMLYKLLDIGLLRHGRFTSGTTLPSVLSTSWLYSANNKFEQSHLSVLTSIIHTTSFPHTQHPQLLIVFCSNQ